MVRIKAPVFDGDERLGQIGRQIGDLDRRAPGVAAVGGQGGGGRPDMAQGGGPNAEAASQALEAIRAALEGVLAA